MGRVRRHAGIVSGLYEPGEVDRLRDEWHAVDKRLDESSGNDDVLDALEESYDVAAFDAAMAEPGDDVSWEQVKADPGWN